MTASLERPPQTGDQHITDRLRRDLANGGFHSFVTAIGKVLLSSPDSPYSTRESRFVSRTNWDAQTIAKPGSLKDQNKTLMPPDLLKVDLELKRWTVANREAATVYPLERDANNLPVHDEARDYQRALYRDEHLMLLDQEPESNIDDMYARALGFTGIASSDQIQDGQQAQL